MDNVDGPNKLNIDELFERALERIDAGEPVPAILNACPEEFREELKILLPVSGGLKDIAYGSVPLPPVERRQRAKSQFLMAVAEEREQQVAAFRAEDQGFAQSKQEMTGTTEDALADSGLAAPKVQRPTRTLIEPEEPSFFERIFSLFARPTMRLAPLALVALLFFGVGAFAASTSYVGHWAYPIKELSRDVGLALVPESAREQRETAQAEAKERDIQRGKAEAVKKNEEVKFSDTVIVEKVEQGDDGTILHTNVGDFVVTLEQASEVLSAPESIKVGDVIEFEALILPINEAPVQLLQLEVVATALPQPAPAKTPQQVVLPIATTCQLNVAGWQPYTVKEGDTLAALAIRGDIDYNVLAQRNCIGNANNIASGSNIYLPPAAILQSTPVNTATTVPTVTVAPVLVEQTPTEMPAVVPDVLQPEVIATPVSALPTPTEVDGTVTLTITEAVTNTAPPLELTSTASAPPTVEAVEGELITPTVEISTTVDTPPVELTLEAPTIVTPTITVSAPTGTVTNTETVIETPVPAPTVVGETSPITETQTIEADGTETVVEIQVNVTDPISSTVSFTETTSVPVSDLPTEVPALEPSTVPTSTIPTVTIPITTQPVEVPTSESSGESLPGNSEGAAPTIALTITVAPETPTLAEPEVSGASLDPTATTLVTELPVNETTVNESLVIETSVNDTASEVSTATTLPLVITVDAGPNIAVTATITPIVTLEPTYLAPVASPIPLPPPPQATAQTAPAVVTAITIPSVAATPGSTATPLAADATVLPVPVVVEPVTLATAPTDSSNQQLQADEVQPTIIESGNPAVPAATVIVIPTNIVAPTISVATVVPQTTINTAVPAAPVVVPTGIAPPPTVSVSTQVPQTTVNTAVPPIATAIIVAPAATTIDLAPVSPLTP